MTFEQALDHAETAVKNNISIDTVTLLQLLKEIYKLQSIIEIKNNNDNLSNRSGG